jgi:hypothetical protein
MVSCLYSSCSQPIRTKHPEGQLLQGLLGALAGKECCVERQLQLILATPLVDDALQGCMQIPPWDSCPKCVSAYGLFCVPLCFRVKLFLLIADVCSLCAHGLVGSRGGRLSMCCIHPVSVPPARMLNALACYFCSVQWDYDAFEQTQCNDKPLLHMSWARLHVSWMGHSSWQCLSSILSSIVFHPF